MENPIPVISVGEPNFQQEAAHWLERKRNFIVIGTSEAEIREKISHLVPLDGYRPDSLNRWGIYALAEVLKPDDLNTLLLAEREKKTLSIIEQIKLPLTKPPRVQPVLVYSEPQGIIAHFDTFQQAKEFLQKHRAPWNNLQKFPLAGIYQWEHEEWHQVRAFV